MGDLQEFLASLKTPFWLTDPQFVGYSGELPTVTDIELNQVLDKVHYNLQRQRTGRAVNWLALGIRLRGDAFLGQVRRLGLLRPSKYGFHAAALQRATRTLCQHAEALQLSPSAGRYLGSAITLSMLASAVLSRQQALIEFLRANRAVVLKGLLATVDFMFMWETPGKKTASTEDVAFYSKEDLAEGLSLIVNLFAVHFGLTDRDISLLDAKAVSSNQYASILVDACVIRKFQEWEILVDILGYEFISDGEGRAFVFSSPDIALSKSLRLGYIQTNMQVHAHHSGMEKHEAMPLRVTAENFYKSFRDRFVEYVAEPLPRYRYHIPLIPEFFKFFSDDTFFREEVYAVSTAAKENLASFDKILTFTVYEDLSLFDLIKVQRLFGFLRFYIAAHLAEVFQRDRVIAFRSLVPRFERRDLVDMLGHVIPRHKVPHVIELLSWKPQSGCVFDIQYQPLLSLNDIVTVPVSILAVSNIVRNSLQLLRERIHGPKQADPVSDLIEDALKQARWGTKSRLKYAFSGVTGEIDLLSYASSTLFVFESKNSLHPCNMHEIRTSLDHIRRATVQLRRFLTLQNKPGFWQYMSNLTGWPLSTGTILVTCIVTGNRMFTGYRLDGSPVRSVHELVAFVKDGTVNIGDQVRRFWKSDTLTTEDLIAYLQEDLLHRPQFDAMEPVRHQYLFDDFLVYEEAFALDILKAAERLGFDVSALPVKDAAPDL